MTFIAYAHNLEDVMLFRALGHVGKGSYIDVGAYHPTIGSLTKAFYDRGWRGINIEPNPRYFTSFLDDRKEDVNLNVAAGDHKGKVIFHEVEEDKGLSTTNESYAKRHFDSGLTLREITVESITLDEICALHGVTTVHFLKIDVEGAEESVLRGFSFDAVRPWVVVVEANEPYSTRDASASWEPLLLRNDYSYVYYDGVSRFYVAAEHADLSQHFDRPPNILDDYMMYSHWIAEQDQLRLKAVYSSFSWRLTAPLRAAERIFDSLASLVTRVVPHFVGAVVAFLMRHERLRQTVSRLVPQGTRSRILGAIPPDHLPVSVSLARRYGQVASVLLQDVGQAPETGRQMLIDITSLGIGDNRTGIPRVTRSLVPLVAKKHREQFMPRPVFRSGGTYRYASDAKRVHAAAGDVFLGIDLDMAIEKRTVEWLARKSQLGLRAYFVVYDLLPAVRPDWFQPEVHKRFVPWLRSVATVADGLVCISKTVSIELMTWLEAHPVQRARPLNVGYFHLGANVEASIPSSGLSVRDSEILEEIKRRSVILMVGIVQERKGHEQALRALERLWSSGRDLLLVVVGREGWFANGFTERLRRHPELGKRLLWLETASDEMLTQLYRLATVLLAASEGEGFGLPVVEAGRHGLPVIARDLPVFREVAGEHAYYFSGTDDADLALVIERWLQLRNEGRYPQPYGMEQITWDQSAGEFGSVALDGKWQGEWSPVTESIG